MNGEETKPLEDAAQEFEGRADGPAEEAEDIESLKSRLESALGEAALLREEAARAKADFYNYRTRIERDRAKSMVLAAEGAVLGLLPVLDNLERALDAGDKESSMYKGISMVKKQFLAALQNLGLREIEASGAFDPSLHEAVMTVEVESDDEDGIVAETLHRGYMLGDKVLQAAKVKVCRKIDKKEDAAD
jgi:molecular chaperone GrpE (heat shock protein)